MSSVFGEAFRISTFGESHGAGVGVVIDGCPSLLEISVDEIQAELDRRRPGQSKITTQRKEEDKVQILSGVQDGVTLGTPIALLVMNKDQRSRDYDEMQAKHRPSHADFTYHEKYGIKASSGGGRASARETIGRVAAGAVAQKLLKHLWGVEVTSWVQQVKEIDAAVAGTPTREQVEANIVRCPDQDAAEQMIALIESTRKEGDSLGGIISCHATGVPAGWGEPVFDKLEAELAKAMLSLPACKGFESGSGFAGTQMTGREHNDPFRGDGTEVWTTQNNSGGIQGGISNGMPITFRCAFKPTATILHEQDTVDVDKQNTTLAGKGRHDPCVLPRAVPMVDAMAALVLVDHALRSQRRSN
jgi:chorismate synthase